MSAILTSIAPIRTQVLWKDGDRRLSSADYFTSNSQHIIDIIIDNIQFIDMDNDEDYNLVGTTNDMLVWYENIGSQEYVRHNVSSTLRLVSSQGIYATDVNNDTYIDIIIAIGYEFVGIY